MQTMKSLIIACIIMVCQLSLLFVDNCDANVQVRTFVFEQLVDATEADVDPAEADIIETIQGCHSLLVCARACRSHVGNKTCLKFKFHESTEECELLVSTQATESVYQFLNPIEPVPPVLPGATFDKFDYVSGSLRGAFYNCSNDRMSSLRLAFDHVTWKWERLQGACAQSMCQQVAFSNSLIRISVNATGYFFYPSCQPGDTSDGFSRCDFDGTWTTVTDSGFHCYLSTWTCYSIKANGRVWYDGLKTTTKNGVTCQRWVDRSPHGHIYTGDGYYPEDGYSVTRASNYCRDPDGTGGPWCYTTGAKRWTFCGVHKCE